MTIRVGVIGAGVMGGEHARLMREELRGVELAAVADQNIEAAGAAAGSGAAYRNGEELVADPQVEAVLVASPDQTHFGLVEACIAAGKPVLCEKPLAMTAEESLRLVHAEAAQGKRLIDVGFMRRYDPAYRQLKARLDSGVLGRPRIVHNQHRNAVAPAWFTANMALTNSAVHEIDICRWLLGMEYTTGRILQAPAAEGSAQGDPMMITFETEGGPIVSTEVFMNAQYGYHVQCEIAGSLGNTLMAHSDLTRLRLDRSEQGAFPANWIPRFAEAYRLQDQAWINALETGKRDGLASAWDGFVATFVAEKLVEAAELGETIRLDLPERPAMQEVQPPPRSAGAAVPVRPDGG